jgi:hypothetical protein
LLSIDSFDALKFCREPNSQKRSIKITRRLRA